MFGFKKEDVLTIPNLLSLVRLLLIPVIVISYVKFENYILAVILLLLSGITDIVDGAIARKFNMVSDFGKILDPIADKLTQGAVLLCLVSRFNYMIYLFIFYAVKEIFMGVTGVLRIQKTGRVHGADWHGKLTTVTLYSVMLLHIIWINIPLLISQTTVIISSCIMALSMVLYGIDNISSALHSAK